MTEKERLPKWMKMQLPKGETYSRVKNIVKDNKLHTICTSGNCPNIGECWNRGTATFMILGDICTRSCKFCAVTTGRPLPVDIGEPRRVSESIKKMELKHCVITSVDRDDLPDFGAQAWTDVIGQIKSDNPRVKIEALIPDFQGDQTLIEKVVNSGADVVSHNMETVRSLTNNIRSVAKYDQSLRVIHTIAQNHVIAKSGLMLGLGEDIAEVQETLHDLRHSGCKVISIGQYLAPSAKHYPVQEYIKPEVFEHLKEFALNLGFTFVESAPLVRSSYRAELHAEAK
ncbi:MAG: lipoyl synthase [Bacteroidales bacterium]